MLSKEQRKEAINKFKERKILQGIFAVRRSGSADVWVGSSRNLGAAKNGLWFSLRAGVYRDSALQKHWNTEGDAAFGFEMLETLEADISPLLVSDLLKNKKQNWAKRLHARELL